MCIIGLVYCVVYFVYLGGLLYYMLAYHRCNLCSEYLCYVMPGCFALSCPKNFSAQTDPVLFCASDNKSLELEAVQLEGRRQCSWREGDCSWREGDSAAGGKETVQLEGRRLEVSGGKETAAGGKETVQLEGRRQCSWREGG